MERGRRSVAVWGLELALAAVVADAGGRGAATRSTDASTWMPDVAGRVESLRERLRVADAEATSRMAAGTTAQQWWRGVVTLPDRRWPQ